MTDDREDLARLDERSKSQDDRITKLEGNQRWAVVGVLGLLMKAVADFLIYNGGGQ